MSDRPEDRLALFINNLDKSVVSHDKVIDFFHELKNVEPRKKTYLQYRLSEDEPAYIIPVSDIHFGSIACNSQKLKAVLDLIERVPNCYTILLGDMAETATRDSVGKAMYDEEYHLPEQMKLLCNALAPLANKGKILGMLTGNHEMRVANLVGINPMAILAEQLDVPYLGYQGYLMVRVGSQQYKIMCHHGVGSGTTMPSKVRAVEKLSSIAEADIYISGHTHGLHYHYDQIMTFNDEGQIVPRKRHYVVAGSFMEYWGGYAEMKLLQPSSTGVVVMELMPHQKEVRVTI